MHTFEKKSVKNQSNITIQVGLDDDKKPIDIQWIAEDDPEGKKLKNAKAMFVSFFDRETKETLKIDLWTPEFQVQEMDRMMFQTLAALTDTYFKATNNNQLAGAMQQFVRYFGEETGVIKKAAE